jgi:hypothetical protein
MMMMMMMMMICEKRSIDKTISSTLLSAIWMKQTSEA